MLSSWEDFFCCFFIYSPIGIISPKQLAHYKYVPTLIKNMSFKRLPFWLHLYIILTHNNDGISTVEPLICSRYLAPLPDPSTDTSPFNHRSAVIFWIYFWLSPVTPLWILLPTFSGSSPATTKADTLCAEKFSHRLSFWWSNGEGKLCSARGIQDWMALQHSVSK